MKQRIKGVGFKLNVYKEKDQICLLGFFFPFDLALI